MLGFRHCPIMQGWLSARFISEIHFYLLFR
jgi:hypothetical protein